MLFLVQGKHAPPGASAGRRDSEQPRSREFYEDERARKRHRSSSLRSPAEFKPFDFSSTEFSKAAGGSVHLLIHV